MSDKNDKKFKLTYKVAIAVAITAIVIFCIVSVIFKIMPPDVLTVNYIGAALSSLIGALITFVLLSGQTDIEEKKGKDIKILEKKTEVFQDFINDIWKIWEEQKITIDEFQKLTSKYYKNLMLYLGKSKLTDIGNYLSRMGRIIGKSEGKDIEELRTCIIETINTLSDEIKLGGMIDVRIMDEHDRIVFPLVFKNSILEAVNKALPTGTILEEGKFEIIKEGGNNYSVGECLCYDFKKYRGCRFVIYDFFSVLTIYFIVNPTYKEFDNFRGSPSSRSGYNQLIKLQQNDINLLKLIPGDTDKEDAPLIVLSISDKVKNCMEKHQKSMETYRTEKREFADVLAARIRFNYDEAKIKNTEDLGIEAFLARYYVKHEEE